MDFSRINGVYDILEKCFGSREKSESFSLVSVFDAVAGIALEMALLDEPPDFAKGIFLPR